MSKITAVKAALSSGGVPELVRRTRLWAASRVYPGTMPDARGPKPAKPSAPAVQLSATDVDHPRALAWFEGRRATYERLAAAVAPYVDPDGVFFDVGGNIGYFTKVLAEAVDFRGTVHLFEPVPNLARLCAITLEGAPYQAKIHEFGLSEQDATLDIFIGSDGNLGWNTMVADRATSSMPATQIRVRAFAGAGIVDVPSFIKIDVEGAEHRVLAGMFDALELWDKKPAILCEIGWGVQHPQWAEELAAFERMTELGYRTTDLDGQPLDVATLERTTDVLFLPS